MTTTQNLRVPGTSGWLSRRTNTAVGSVLVLMAVPVVTAAEVPSFVQDGRAGFVVSNVSYALSKDAHETGACPNGMTVGRTPEAGSGAPNAAPAQRPAAGAAQTQTAQPQTTGGNSAGQRSQGGTEDEAMRRYFAQMAEPGRANPCSNPEAFKADPNFKTVKVRDIKAFGIDLDGQDSRANGKAAPGTCAHDDLPGMNGERGIDNQFFRVVGCSNSYQSTGQSNGYAIEMLTGAWGILITLDGVDDIRNDDSVDVGLFANADPIELSPNREPLRNATYAIDQDPRFQARTRGRIKDGVLTTDPVNVRFHKITNGIYLERPLNAARVSMTLSADGVLDGYLAGYTSVDDIYDFQYAFRNGKKADGSPADRRLVMVSANGQAAVLGHTCNGAYYALRELADGDRDPATGQCRSISTQYRITAIPAFVVEAKTSSVNDDLERKR
jgi:hypothetical protein